MMIELPYLDEDGPDLFEITGNASQDCPQQEETHASDDVIATSINMNEALDFISGKIDKIDFSSIKDSCPQDEKFRLKNFKWHYDRIKHEIDELSQILKQSDNDTTPIQLLKQLQESFQSLLSISTKAPSEFTSCPTVSQSLEKAERSKRENQINAAETAKFFDLEKRLNALETVLGVKSDDLVSLMAKFNCNSLYQLVDKINSIVDLIEDEKVAEFEMKLQNFDDKVKHATTAKDELFKNLNLINVAELTQNPLNLSLIAKRLLNLKELHNKAGDFVQLLWQLNSHFEQLSYTVSSQKSVIETLSESLEKTAQTVQSNLDCLHNKLN